MMRHAWTYCRVLLLHLHSSPALCATLALKKQTPLRPAWQVCASNVTLQEAPLAASP